MRKLTPREAAFVREFQIDHNGSAAARRAGYSVKNAAGIASDLRKKPAVAAAIAANEAAATEKTGITKEAVLTNLAELRQGAVSAKQYGPAVRAAELIGKELGMFKDSVEIEMKRKSDEDLIADIAKGDPALAAALRKRLVGDESDPLESHTTH